MSPGITLEVHRRQEKTVIDLCRSQYLDLRYQSELLTLNGYLELVRLKTGVLLGILCEVSALVAGAQTGAGRLGSWGEGQTI